MSGFKIEKDRIAGLCGQCANRSVQITLHGQAKVRCKADNGRLVKEPLSYCQLYREDTVFSRPVPNELVAAAWYAIERRQGDRLIKTFVPPDDADDMLNFSEVGFTGRGWMRERRK